MRRGGPGPAALVERRAGGVLSAGAGMSNRFLDSNRIVKNAVLDLPSRTLYVRRDAARRSPYFLGLHLSHAVGKSVHWPGLTRSASWKPEFFGNLYEFLHIIGIHPKWSGRGQGPRGPDIPEVTGSPAFYAFWEYPFFLLGAALPLAVPVLDSL